MGVLKGPLRVKFLNNLTLTSFDECEWVQIRDGNKTYLDFILLTPNPDS